MSTTFPRSSSTVNGCELSHAIAPTREGSSPSISNSAVADVVWYVVQSIMLSWVAAMVLSMVVKK
ncbi:hypothetical protein AB3R30_13605 [Leptolyngbyaceae cyanobacterium UHCC 1019]